MRTRFVALMAILPVALAQAPVAAWSQSSDTPPSNDDSQKKPAGYVPDGGQGAPGTGGATPVAGGAAGSAAKGMSMGTLAWVGAGIAVVAGVGAALGGGGGHHSTSGSSPSQTSQ